MLDRTYGHLLKDSASFVRGLLDRYDASAASAGAAVGSVDSASGNGRGSDIDH